MHPPSIIKNKDSGAVEYAYSLMARTAGIDMMPTRLFPAKKGYGYFGVRRFDRSKNTRLHMHTACGLLHSDHHLPSLDYQEVTAAINDWPVFAHTAGISRTTTSRIANVLRIKRANIVRPFK